MTTPTPEEIRTMPKEQLEKWLHDNGIDDAELYPFDDYRLRALALALVAAGKQ